MFINTIGPIWDGNEVWLVTFGGAMLAAFPEAYATVFSGFYPSFMLLLFALIFRAVSIEFRSKMRSAGWRGTWDIGFFASSLVATLLFGVGGQWDDGNAAENRGVFIGRFFDLLNPYALLSAWSPWRCSRCMERSIFLKLPHGEARDRVRGWMWHSWGIPDILHPGHDVHACRDSASNCQLQTSSVGGRGSVIERAGDREFPGAVHHNRPVQAFRHRR